MIKYLSLCLFFLALTQRSFADEDENQRYLRRERSSSSPSIAAIAADTPSFSTLVSVLGKTGLDKALDCPQRRWCSKYTVFAPDNDAFDAVAEADPDFFTALTGEEQYEEHLRQLLLYHVVSGTVKSEDIEDGPVLSVQCEELELSTVGGIKVNQANVMMSELKTESSTLSTLCFCRPLSPTTSPPLQPRPPISTSLSKH